MSKDVKPWCKACSLELKDGFSYCQRCTPDAWMWRQTKALPSTQLL